MTQESSHFIPAEFSDSFFKEFDLARRIKREELKKQGKSSAQVNEITERDMIQAFGVTEDKMEKAAEILGKDRKKLKSQEIRHSDYQKGMNLRATMTVWRKQRRTYYSYNQGIQKVPCPK